MTTTLTTRITKLKAHLRARIEEWEKATAGPWQEPRLSRDDVTRNCAYVLADGYFGAICTVHMDDGKSIQDGGGDDPIESEAKANGLCIASSRTETPRALKLLLEEVEWLEEKLNIDSKFYGIWSFFARKSLMTACEERLTAILDAYKEEIS